MNPKDTPMYAAHSSKHERVFMLPHAFQTSVMLEGMYSAGIAWILFLAYLRVLKPAENGPLVAVLGIAALIGTGLLGRACWICFADGVLTLRADEVIWERTWKRWKHTRRLATAEITAIHTVVSGWASSKKKTVRGVEIKAGRRRIRFGWELSWEEKYWLSQEAKAFLSPFSPHLQAAMALEQRREDAAASSDEQD